MKVGDYVRTKEGYINRIIKDDGCCVVVDDLNVFEEELHIAKLDIVKNSPNIIDLIEVGDYVNGIYIDTIEKEQKRIWHTSCYGDDDIVFYNNDIKSIVTKEMFESMEYKL